MNFDYDVTIVGAGPMGSSLSYELSKENLKVCLIDKKKVIGLPLQCAGIINKRVLDLNQIPNEFILNKARGAYLHTKNHSLTVSKDEYQALIIDRIALDQYLYNRAIESGVDSYLSSKALAIAEILDDFLRNDFKYDDYEVIEKYKGRIPVYNKNNRLYKNRAIVIGDAAAQVKPTTGGGLLIGFETIQIAKKSILTALKSNVFNSNDELNSKNDSNLERIVENDKEILQNAFKDYQKDFEKRFLKEMSIQFKVQETLCTLSDDDLDYLFKKLKEKEADKLISKYGDMDNQSILVKEFLKRGLILSLLPSIHKKELAKIWLL